MEFRLVQCDAQGIPVEEVARMPQALLDANAASAALFADIGFAPPWVSYVALDGATAVGGGAFIGAPRDGRVEIAYFTLDGMTGRGYATETARALLATARRAAAGVIVAALTLPEPNASTRVLAKAGFAWFGEARDKDIGRAWEWRAPVP